ncbi:MBL fold metallo-hydrolase [Streptobacillus ratti]|uniref:MBL fold metallo-hydrolase n=1 Tax=Streptobacillus ratti TaxID=1720557 RepID=UPI0009331AFA|nr:MBL fold metallo-hydrolase [Streptobacillus ratti]
MKVAVLGSSSSGNSTFVEVGGVKLLVDVGFSLKKIIEKLESINEKLEDIYAVFITHEHIDHVKSLGPLLRKTNAQVYIHEDSYNVIKSKLGKYDEERIIFLNKREVYIENACIINFDLTHDAEHCLGYSFIENNKKFVYITDAGYVTKAMELQCQNADVIAIESNYDYDLLMSGSYPWDIKSRIKGKFGHLSNQDCLKLLRNSYTEKLKKIFLMHLSEENNMPSLAIHNIKKEYKKIDIEVSDENVTSIFEI